MNAVPHVADIWGLFADADSQWLEDNRVLPRAMVSRRCLSLSRDHRLLSTRRGNGSAVRQTKASSAAMYAKAVETMIASAMSQRRGPATIVGVVMLIVGRVGAVRPTLTLNTVWVEPKADASSGFSRSYIVLQHGPRHCVSLLISRSARARALATHPLATGRRRLRDRFSTRPSHLGDHPAVRHDLSLFRMRRSPGGMFGSASQRCYSSLEYLIGLYIARRHCPVMERRFARRAVDWFVLFDLFCSGAELTKAFATVTAAHRTQRNASRFEDACEQQVPREPVVTT